MARTRFSTHRVACAAFCPVHRRLGILVERLGEIATFACYRGEFRGLAYPRCANPRALRFGRRVLRRNISPGRLPDTNFRRRPWSHHDCGDCLGQVGPGGFDSYLGRVRRIGILGTIPMVGHRRRGFGFGGPVDEALHAAGTGMRGIAIATQGLSLFAVGTIATLALSGALAATTAVIPIEKQKLIVRDSGTAVLGVANPEVTVVEYFAYKFPLFSQDG